MHYNKKSATLSRTPDVDALILLYCELQNV